MKRTDRVHSEDIELSAGDHTNSQDPLRTTIHQMLSLAFPFYFLIDKFKFRQVEKNVFYNKLSYIVKQ